MTKTFIAAACLLVAACTSAAASLTPDEEKLVSALGVDAKIAAQLKDSSTTIERLKGLTRDFDEIDADGIVISVKPGDGERALAEAREQLRGTVVRTYLNDQAFGYGPDKLAIVRTDDLGYLAIVRTAGINFDIPHEQVVERYKAWDAQYGLELVGAGPDWLEAKFRRPPTDWLAFAREVAKFCPDVVEQGSGDVESLAKEMAESNRVYLWWD